MRRLLLLTLFAIFVLNPAQALSQVVADLVDEPANTDPCYYEVTVRVSTAGEEISRSQFTLEYDSACLALDPNDISLGEGLDPFDFQISTKVVNPPGLPPGSEDSNVIIVVDNPSGTAGYSGIAVVVLRIRFQWVGPSGGLCAISFDDRVPPNDSPPTELTTLEGTDINAETGLIFSGTSENRPFFTLSGSVYYYGPDFEAVCEFNPVVPNAIVTLRDDMGAFVNEVPTDAAGLFSFTGLVEGNYNLTVARDVQGNDRRAISGADAVLLFQATSGAVLLHPRQERAGDVAGLLGEDPPGVPITLPNGILDPPDPVAVSNWLAFLRDPADAGSTGTWDFDILPSGEPSTNITLGCPSGNTNLCVTAYFLGDANASWPPGPLKSADISPMVLTLKELVREGNQVVLGLDADLKGETLESLLYTLEYGDNLRYLGMEAGSRTQGFYAVDNPAEPGIVHGALIGGRAFAKESGRVLNFRFELLDPDGSATVSFERLEANDLPAQANTVVFGEPDDQPGQRPDAAALSCAPNPFNPSTKVTYSVPGSATTVPVRLQVYDASGRFVRELVNSEQGAGTYTVTWTGNDESGRTVSTGVYYLRLQAGRDVLVYKTALVK